MEHKRHYSDFFSVPEGYRANMTREAINETPETWLDFYPHIKYVEFLTTLLSVINGGSKSIWLTGNYGTGKSNAALVTQKLFMDEEKRVKQWIDDCKSAISDSETLYSNLLKRRNENTLVIYDYNASGIGANEEFLVRLERSIISSLSENKLIIPPKANFNEIINRLSREGQNFFATRDSIQNELVFLNASIKTVEQLISELQKAHKGTDAPVGLLGDVQKVFHRDHIYLDISVTTFKSWIKEIVAANNLGRIIYIFDEFSEFIDTNKEHLKTFEDVTENPGISKFYLVPVTHLSIKAYWSENSAGANKANDRFYFRNLQMPNDTAFKLAAHAMKPNPDPIVQKEWEEEKKTLWDAIRGIAEVHFKPEDVSKQSFRDILPIHPMAAFLLKFLSESARSNQRSIFEYLKGSADGQEFQDFIKAGGPGIASKQFLTVDYLWDYFIGRRDDPGHHKAIDVIRAELERIKSREFQNRDDDDEDIRVLKAVLLFCLLTRLNPDGHERLRPTVQNIELSFQGDGSILGIKGIIANMADKHCFSVVNGNIELFATSVGGAEIQKKVAEYENKFHELFSDKTENMLKTHTKNAMASHSAGRFDIRVSDASHTTLTNISTATREKYGIGATSGSSVCLWFVVAKNKEEQLQIPDKIKSMLENLKEHRILMFSFPHLTFCDNNTDLWNEYVLQYAQFMLENDQTAKKQRKDACDRLEQEWFNEIKKQSCSIKVHSYQNGQIVVNDTSWAVFKSLISDYVRKKLECCVDYLTPQLTAFGITALKAWATAGIQFEAASGQYKQLVNNFKSQGISAEDSWFLQNPTHPLAQIRSFFDKKIANTVGRGSSLSLRKVYIELQRPPYGMKYNVLSAFVLGFVLGNILDRGYQWDNLQKTQTLDAETLADIIEAVVKDDGQDKIKGEKLICRLSKEDKVFIEKGPQMFGVSNISSADGRIEDALLLIQTRIEAVSNRVPLWVLPEYIRSVNDPQADVIDDVLNKICLAGYTSSKSSKTEERSNAIKDVGGIILSNGEIVDIIAGYIKPENFIRAFQIYVDKTEPLLMDLANSVGDISHRYCDSILEKTAPTSGWLWNHIDIAREIEETMGEYKVIKILCPIAGYSDFIPFQNIVAALRMAVTVTNKLPKSLIESVYPTLSSFFSCFGNSLTSNVLRESLEQNTEIISKLFFDNAKSNIIELLKLKLVNTNASNNDLLEVYSETTLGFASDENSFLSDLRSRIEARAKSSIAQNLKYEWTRITMSNTPDQWASDSGLPSRFAISNSSEAEDILYAVQTPDKFSVNRLNELIDVMKGIAPSSIADCQKRFISETISCKFAKFNINLSSLLEYLQEKYGKQPNIWPKKPDIGDFIRSQYQGTFAPQVTEKIEKTSADDLKRKLLLLAKESPELGLMFWE